ncbi:MAG: VWA domain-containing protein, partial [Acidobacteriota bacterium]|nr:VWA domain-containing protein [Acidobacteriota bacterium]
NTNLITVPVIATTSDGNYIPDLRQNEFSVSEDGVKQELAFFATVSAPFHVVLLLDTSASTQEKLGAIQRAAVAFVEQLQNADRVKIISFDSEIRALSEFTNDRAALRGAIYKTASGEGTRLYDAFETALSSLRAIQGRKAIVLFTDGVDFHSDNASSDSTLHWLDEEGVIVYPIRFETRAETERIARQAGEDITPQLPTIDVIRRPPSGTSAPTFPSDDPTPVPTSGRSSKTGPLGLPTAGEILRRKRERDAERYPSPDRLPPPSRPNDPRDGRNDPRDTGTSPRDIRTDPTEPRPDRGSTGRGSRSPDDEISVMLDQLYVTADSYLNQLANKSGGRLLRADTIASLPDAFAKIAAELRTQYAIGYYPTNKARDGQYRKLRVTSTRKNVILRARPGYLAPSGG